MVADPDEEVPLLTGKGQLGRRRRRRREPTIAWWIGFAVLGLAAWSQRSWRVALLLLLLWCLYEFCLVPAICRITTRQGYSCVEPVRGRLFGCTAGHQELKTDALWRLAGLRNPFRTPREPDVPDGTTGVLVVSPAVRGRLPQTDRVLLILAAAGSVVALAATVYDYL
jgi:hypothetical protein